MNKVQIKDQSSPLGTIFKSFKNYRAGEVAEVLSVFKNNEGRTIVNVRFDDGLCCAFNKESLKSL